MANFVLPPRRERTVSLNLPDSRTRGDAAAVSAAILEAVTGGEITLGEATELARLVAGHIAALESPQRYESAASLFPGLKSFLRRRSCSGDDK